MERTRIVMRPETVNSAEFFKTLAYIVPLQQYTLYEKLLISYSKIYLYTKI